MPKLALGDVTLNYSDTGEGAETIVFSHGFLMSRDLFAPQIAALKDRYRCIAYDHRGQAGSSVPEGGYDIDTVAEDARKLIEALDVGPVHFVGLSMGGFVGMRLALRHPELLKSLVLMDTSADAEPHTLKYRALGVLAKLFGLGLVAKTSMNILFGQSFMTDPDRATERATWQAHITSHDRTGILKALRGVTDRDSVYERLGQITVPTLVLTGEEDVATVPDKGRRIAQAIPGAVFDLIPKAGHSAPIENPAAVTEAVSAFTRRVSAG